MRVLQQICMCRHEYDSKRDLLRLLDVHNETTKCIREKKQCNLGFIEIRVVRRFLSSQVIIILDGKEVSAEEFNRLLSTARFFREWYESDCSVDAYMQPMIGVDHYDAIKEFLVRNLNELQSICFSSKPILNFENLPTYVVDGINRAVSDFTNGTVRKI
nr:MAG: hypothetical protein TU36_01450 [Vulcanisaeta sp. AZ3]